MNRTVDPIQVEHFLCPWTGFLWPSATLEILWSPEKKRWFTQVDYLDGGSDAGAYLDVATHRLWRLNHGLRERVIEAIKARAALFLECWI